MNTALPKPHWRTEWLWWLGPIFLLFVLYREGLQVWFLEDDFAWLGLLRQAHGFRSVMELLFGPAAQGTIRPWSERGFFMLFESIFGINPLPFRFLVFVTVSADLVLLQWLTRRLTGSRLAGMAAAVCWLVNPALATVMSWTSAFNEALCPLFLLSATALFVQFADTGDRRFWWWQLVVFSLGFGALEINVVYPAIAAAYVLFVAAPQIRRRLLVSIAPLAVLSVVYFVIHRAVAPLPSSGAYAIRLDSRVFATFAIYVKWALLPMNWRNFGHSSLIGSILLVVEALAITLLFAGEIRKRRWVVFFFAAWFLATLAPMLILPEHRDDYYLTIPLIGLAMLAGWGVALAMRNAGKWRMGAAIPVLAYLAAAVPVSNAATHWWFARSVAVKGLVLGVAAAHELHPGKVIVLDGITSALFNDAIGHSAFFPLGIDAVYLTPGSESRIRATPDLAELRALVLDSATLNRGIRDEAVVLYSFAGDHLRNITERYQRSAPDPLTERLPGRADVGNPLYSWLLSKEWLPPENGFRWMPGQASLRLAGPERSGGDLRIQGYCPEEQLKLSPRRLAVAVDGVLVGDTQINDPETNFVRLFLLPPSVTGRKAIEVRIQVTPVVRRDGQDFGLIFGEIAIQPRLL